ncbi:MAG TPA: hypothetical protein DDZ80_25875 [Cyanobacteria bacterium UBA8803]|nr:hypothetical protein [Cyanobacteria bacterium UBA9273]HBL61722.1 hypothetical protein [Cyanobacteria bacterium UBA8803]
MKLLEILDFRLLIEDGRKPTQIQRWLNPSLANPPIPHLKSQIGLSLLLWLPKITVLAKTLASPRNKQNVFVNFEQLKVTDNPLELLFPNAIGSQCHAPYQKASIEAFDV